MGWLSFDDCCKPLRTPGGLGGFDAPGPVGLGGGFGTPGPRTVVRWDAAKQQKLIQKLTIPEGDAGTEATIQVMQNLALEAAQDPNFVMFVRKLVQDIPSKQYRAELERIFAYVKRNIRYRRDPMGLEFVPSPSYLLFVSGQDDCDGISTLLAAMALADGLGAGFKSIKADRSRPNDYSHVYAMLGYPDRTQPTGVTWLPADATQTSSVALGWEPPPSKVIASKIWTIANP